MLKLIGAWGGIAIAAGIGQTIDPHGATAGLVNITLIIGGAAMIGWVLGAAATKSQ